MQTYQFAEDGDLLARIGQGSEEALGALYDRYRRPCFSFAVRILGSESDAEEAVQECFVRVWRRGASFDSARGNVTTWLFSIVRNICVDELRKRRRRLPSDGLEGFDTPDDYRTDDEVERGMIGEQVREAMRELPGDQRRAIELVYFQGLTSTEVGTALEVSPATVRSRLRLGLLKLATILDAAGVTER